MEKEIEDWLKHSKKDDEQTIRNIRKYSMTARPCLPVRVRLSAVIGVGMHADRW
ncbi:MAG: hypothetical protein ACE5KZ_14735 [Candidatus Scalinduaceae bacterium]